MFTRKHGLAMRASFLSLLGVVLLAASVGAAWFSDPSGSLDDVAAAAPPPQATDPVATPSSEPAADPTATSTREPTPPPTATPTVPATATQAPTRATSMATTPATATTVALAQGWMMPTATFRTLIDRIRDEFPQVAGAAAVPSATPVTPTPEPTPTATPFPVDDGTRIFIPHRTQFDGSYHEDGNCGPAALAMILEYFGHYIGTHDLRVAINHISGDWSRDGGTTWDHLRRAAEPYGLLARGLTDDNNRYRQWTMDDLLAETRAGRPVIVLVHYRSLPGHEDADWWGDHYVVFLGMNAAGEVVYHDPALPPGEGEYVTLSQSQFEHAWSNTWIGDNRQAMSLGLP